MGLEKNLVDPGGQAQQPLGRQCGSASKAEQAPAWLTYTIRAIHINPVLSTTAEP